ncbi:PREDICTED: vomeronasal type-2 receptor 26-like [Nanorana parkeri]|uniref:vomeronasal type-2 receptor 26-like n=1 Tax=Nanorana parkeri TaxID=125878 RepID=UPI0008547940|nr:PREDICTED: vomeronasal type-2 receptor 26-like [Nanorana parkeri]
MAAEQGRAMEEMERSKSAACKLDMKIAFENYKYFKNGDIIIGGIIMVNNQVLQLADKKDFPRRDYRTVTLCHAPYPGSYKDLVYFLYALEHINNDPDILPNITLGYHLYDACGDTNKAIRNTIEIVSGPVTTVPNYSCWRQGNIAGLIGDFVSGTSISIAQILSIYGFSQISHGATDHKLSDKVSYPFFFHTVHNVHVYFEVIADVLKHFSWNWVDIITSNDEAGDREQQLLTKYLEGFGIYSEDCTKCLDTEWPNDVKTECIPKTEEYLSYSTGLAIALCSVSILFLIITILIMIVFILNYSTPIVKANNRNLSFTLLVCIQMSFVCVFLFIGRPTDTTCMYRQVFFGMLFSVAVSSVLAKTITVYVAFKASKPGSHWRKLTGTKMSNLIVLFCSLVQVIICITWLSLYPPYQELDPHSYTRKIIVQCNEGSVIGFYSVLGYMGFLASVSFVIAYLTKKLPDSFNEAKYITFSMLVFCSVWIAMIPAYLSTKGKYMVAVEVFAILVSNAGLVGCICLPKCYIILFKPSINTKGYILSHGKK